jgi:hypothetical protein
VAVAGAVWALAAQAPAQSCTTQAKMGVSTRQQLADAALALGAAIKAGDAASVQGLAATDIAGNFGPTGYLVRTTAEAVAGDSLRVTEVYTLDANGRTDPAAEADFSCPLTGSDAETDFAISPLPAGLYGFAMVEAAGERPWLLAFLLREEGGQWKMAGFYPHARMAAGHDGLWYWRDARIQAGAGQNWLAWLEFGEADKLLRPANFVTSTHLDKLRAEEKTAAPPALRDGLDANTPLVVKGTDSAEFAITGLAAEGSDDGKRLNLALRFRAEPLTDPVAQRTRNLSAARALLSSHPELRTAFSAVFVTVETAGQAPFTTQIAMADVK